MVRGSEKSVFTSEIYSVLRNFLVLGGFYCGGFLVVGS